MTYIVVANLRGNDWITYPLASLTWNVNYKFDTYAVGRGATNNTSPNLGATNAIIFQSKPEHVYEANQVVKRHIANDAVAFQERP